MSDALDRRFDDLIESLVGFYRTWFLSLGVELGLFRALSEAGPAGLGADALAAAAGIHPPAADVWLRGAYAHRIVELVAGGEPPRFALEPAMAQILLDEDSSYYLGGQFVRSVESTLDYGDLSEFFRTGRTIPERAPRHHRAIERVTIQDITLFIEVGLPRLTGLAGDLESGIAALDVACGGGRWMIEMARRYPASRFTGVEFEPDSVSRALAHVAEASLADVIHVAPLDPARMTFEAAFDFAYCQDALHELADPVAALQAVRRALRPGGRVVVFEWCVPSRIEDYRTALGELVWGVQIDEAYQGTRLMTREQFGAVFEAADLGPPERVELEAGATLFVAIP